MLGPRAVGELGWYPCLSALHPRRGGCGLLDVKIKSNADQFHEAKTRSVKQPRAKISRHFFCSCHKYTRAVIEFIE